MEERLQRTRILFSVSLRKPGDLECSGHSRNGFKVYFGSQTSRGFADGFNVWDIKWGGIRDDSQVSVLNEWVESSQNRLSRLLSTRPQLELGTVVHHSHLWQMALCDHANELRYLPTPTLSYSWPFPNQLWDRSAPPTCLLVLEPQMWFGIILSVLEWWSLGTWGCGWGSFPLSSLPYTRLHYDSSVTEHKNSQILTSLVVSGSREQYAQNGLFSTWFHSNLLHSFALCSCNF